MNALESIALVTGVSHSQGIGAASCIELAKMGSSIFLPTGKQKTSGWKRFNRNSSINTV